ncbi:hypothetical protein HBA54_23295 [Pelagibius litoralis]|uniref:Uncharacterized protein n=1 Tax=Pelagibius litoralis TaxID=374515 RepID=A0A967KHQ9_9PROT|nr:hypothetical protein [Pelagibius litoralis]NIA71521.1 hypothetical protein [Pelagibius litoralis]
MLVHCLDADTPAKVSLAGKPVPLGQLCYELLTLIAYHEPIDSQGDIVANWPGHLEPQAGPAARAAAKTAWQGVLQAGSYNLY